jgi:CubicO group peptidase (beta-lactamase class C family)
MRRRHWMVGLALAPGSTAGLASAPGLRTEPLQQLGQRIHAAIAQGQLPAAVLWVEQIGRAPFVQAFGQMAHEPAINSARPMTVDAVFDVASLTKPVVTATLALLALALGAFTLDESFARRLPGWVSDERITWRHLLTHSSGLPASLPLIEPWQGRSAALALAARQQPTHVPGSFFRYSDINFILLGAALEALSGQALAERAEERLFAPLGLRDSGFVPLLRHDIERIVPTQWQGERLLHGEVHDPTARRLGGVAGHAGLFATAADVAGFARAVLQRRLPGVPLAVHQQMAATASPSALLDSTGQPVRRGLGWDIDSPFSRPRGEHFVRGLSFGHTGFTGCAMWLCPQRQGFCVFLSNRVHPHGGVSIVPLYAEVGTAAALAMG